MYNYSYNSHRNYATNAIVEHMLLPYDIVHCRKFMNSKIRSTIQNYIKKSIIQ